MTGDVVAVGVPWQELIADELNREPIIIIRDLVAREVGGEPTRAQLSAARRAANRYAASGRAVIVRTPSDTRHRSPLLTLVRTEPTLAQGRRPRRGRARSDLVVARGLVRSVDRLIPAAGLIDPDTITAADARTLAAALDEPIQHLVRLRLALSNRGLDR